ncbi:peptidoglycan DD-metalloendopeptidase family protein [Consotaella aegiceratis]|uniref:peptidoglycan DD-metalloendopeptidase family protein n=1 Tax=Consotaella aegiceratis TaxID=3097961 RepID=UPI002F3E37C0
MSLNVLRTARFRLIRSAAILSVAGLAAGCSADVVRFDDGFYTGAVPQSTQVATTTYGSSAPTSAAAGYPVAQTYNAPGSNPGAGVQSGSYQSAPVAAAGTQGYGSSSSVQRVELAPPSTSSGNGLTQGTLPPPPEKSATYQTASAAPAMSGSASAPTYSYGASAPSYGAQAPVSNNAPSSMPAPAGMSGPAAVASPSTVSQSSTITVASGDSLGGIARRHGVSVAELRRVNGLSGDTIRIGQTLTLPQGASTQVASLQSNTALSDTAPGRGEPPKSLGTMNVDSAGSVQAATATATPAPAPQQPKAYQPPKPAQEAAPAPKEATAAPQEAKPAQPQPTSTVAKQAEEAKVAAIAPESTGIGQFRWPVQGRVVKGFGDRVGARRNDGLNISVPRGTPVKAAENGVVIYAGEGLKEFGKTVLIKHDDGLVTVYGHADELEVSRGATVKRGQEIAKSGMTGDTDVPILHFEVRKDSAPVDPMKYL